MSFNGLKKTVVFSSIETKNLIEASISDEATATGRTLSSTLEFHLLYEPLLPQSKTAATWIREMYQKKLSIGTVISDYFAFIADNNFKISIENYKSLLQFCKIWGGDTEAHFADQYSIEVLSTQVDCVTDFLLQNADAPETDIYLQADLKREAKRMKAVIADATAKAAISMNKVSIDVLYFYEVCGAFPILKECNRTFKLLACLAKCGQWNDNAKGRYILVELLKSHNLP